jgi:anti-anti-sigma factor
MDGIDAKPPAGMTFAVATPAAGVAVVTVSGELDLGNIEQLTAAVDPVVTAGLERLILEVGGLRFADSSAIALWVQWSTVVGRLELHEPTALLRRVVTTMGLAERLGLTP